MVLQVVQFGLPGGPSIVNFQGAEGIVHFRPFIAAAPLNRESAGPLRSIASAAKIMTLTHQMVEKPQMCPF